MSKYEDLDLKEIEDYLKDSVENDSFFPFEYQVSMLLDSYKEKDKEIERLKTLWEADRQNWACIMYEKEKEIDKLKNNKPDLTNFIKLETAKLNRKREQEKNRLYSENLLLKNDVETLHSIIKEVRELLESKKHCERLFGGVEGKTFTEKALEILDKAGDEK